MTTVFLPYWLHLREPVTITRFVGTTGTVTTADSIDGTTLRGATAAAIGRAVTGADAQRALARLVLSREVRYLPAYPAVDQVRALPLPRSLLSPKPAVVYAVLAEDEVYDQFDTSTSRPDHPTRTVDAIGIVEATAVVLVELRREHPARNQTDRQRGGAGRRVTTTGGDPQTTGSVWTQQVLAAGQTLAGVVALPAADAADLAAELERVWRDGGLGLGRSAAGPAGGWPDVVWGEQRDREVPDEPRAHAAGEQLVVRLTSPVVVRDATTGSTGAAALDAAVHELTGGALLVRDRHVAETAVQGVNRWWGTVTPVVRAAAAGSVLLAEATRPVSAAEVLGWEHRGLGERQRDGFGRLMFTEPLDGPLRITSASAATPRPALPSPSALEPGSFLLDGLRSALDHDVRRRAVTVGRKLADGASNVPGVAVIGRARQLQARRGQVSELGTLTQQDLQKCTVTAGGVEKTDLVKLLSADPPTTVTEFRCTVATGVLTADWDKRWLSPSAAADGAAELVPDWWHVTVAAVLAALHRRAQKDEAGNGTNTQDEAT